MIKVNIEYVWWNESNRRGKIPESTGEKLIEIANRKIKSEIEAGFTSGELFEIQDGKNYRGWWDHKCIRK